MSLTERLTKGVNYKAKQISRPKAVKQSRSEAAHHGQRPFVVHEAASTRRVCLTPVFTVPSTSAQQPGEVTVEAVVRHP